MLCAMDGRKVFALALLAYLALNVIGLVMFIPNLIAFTPALAKANFAFWLPLVIIIAVLGLGALAAIRLLRADSRKPPQAEDRR